ncbi:MAG TPA: AI-2E family transporter [Flavisolibacter sp.]|jgi:predicted PurR-regulated permease PerM|nr:AI-2E family transporter [Flavisolibacter sp.]
MNKTEAKDFRKKVWTATGIVALVVILLWIIKVIFNVLLLLFAGSLIAIFFVGLAGIIHRQFGLKEGLSLTISIIGSLLLLFGFFWLTGNSISQQISDLKQTLPSAVENVKTKLAQSSLGRRVLETATSDDVSGQATSVLQTFFKSTFGVLGDVYIVLFLGIFFTVSPRSYINGIVKLVPPSGKQKANDVVTKLGESLSRWLKGQIFAMFVVFILTAIGLLIIGVPMWLVLSLIAGLLNFIPNFGPLIAMIPAVLIGFLQGPTTALIIAGLYILVQTLESNFVTPQIQKRMLSIPPALIIIAQLIMGVLTGGWGLVLATPVMVVLMVLVRELYLVHFDAEEVEKSKETKKEAEKK